MTDFKNGQELLEVCKKKQCSISEVMKQREIEGTSSTKKEVEDKMRKALAIMKEAVRKPLEDPKPSMSGLIGGEAKQITGHRESRTNVCGTFMNKLIAYSMAVLEVNASMGVIVAAPTAGSSGVVPGVLLALQEEKGFSDEQMTDALFHTAAIGYLLMRNASVAGAEAGCQAEVGAASAMAAAGVVEMFGGTPKQCLDAGSLALSNLLGLVCDPIAGLVEAPCQNRNSIGATNALICAQQALAGIKALIPFDEMVEAMYHVGRSLPFELRESALGGCAGTKTGCQKTCEIFRKNE